MPESDLEQDRERATSMRRRIAGVSLVSAAVWLSQWVWYEKDIFPRAFASHVYRSGEAAICLALVLLAVGARSLKALEWSALALFCALTSLHGYALLTVADSCVVPFLLTLEWSNIVIALAAALSYRPALVLFVVTWLVGAVATRLRPGFDADLSDHVVLAVIYATVVVSIRNYDLSRAAARKAQRELTQANLALQRADEARTRLFTHLSHDFRTPLALIDGEVQALVAAEGDLAAAAALTRVRNSTESLADLIDQLLQLAKLDATRQEPQLADVDVTALARQCLAPFDGGSRAGKLRLEAPAAVLAHVDAQHLRRILHNLLANAVRQLEQGATEVVLKVSAEADVVIAVENDGPRIPEARRELIFERFASFAAAGGVAAGLGLPLARELAELNGGKLGLKPHAARTVFQVTLPRSSAVAASPTAPTTSPTTSPAAGARVPVSSKIAAPAAPAARDLLLVEDNSELGQLLEGVLASHFTVRRATSLAGAVSLVEQQKPDLLLVDLMLPDGNGLDLVERLPHLVPGLPPPVVCLSAVADDATRVRALQQGAQDFLLKPFNAEELLARLGAVLRGVTQREEQLQAQRRALLAELHDGVNAALARAALLLEAAEQQRRSELVPRARSAVSSALEQARTLSVLEAREVVPLGVALAELEGELRSVLAGFGVTSELASTNDGSVHAVSGVEHHTLGRLLVEAVTNALKHGRPTRIDCSVTVTRATIELVVESDGAGLGSERGELSTGSGMRLAALRLQKLGGRLESGPGEHQTWRLCASFSASLGLRRDSQVVRASSAA